MDEKNIFLDKIEDKYEMFLKYDYMIETDFLSLEEESRAYPFLKGKNAVLYGGYPDAERKAIIFIPEYLNISDEEGLFGYFKENPDDNPFCLIKISIPKQEKRELNHRDYMGAILGLGIKREKVGDIVVNGRCAFVTVSKEISEYILENLRYVGRVAVCVTLSNIEDGVIKEEHKEELKLNVPSARLDNIISEIFRVKRIDAKDAIEKGFVFVNGIEVNKPDFFLKGNEKIVFRTKGKAYYNGIISESRKGNLFISVTKYV